jgi:oligopeptide transport system substrate-binding protein
VPERVPQAHLRVASSFLPDDADPRSAIAWPNIQLCMQLFDRLVEQWPERTIVPSLAERWEISDDGLRYVFHLARTHVVRRHRSRHTTWFGIKGAGPQGAGLIVAIYFVLEGGQEYYLGQQPDASAVGVRALDDRTVEFRLAAPAPYFMSVMNRPDGGPQPRHAIEASGDAWTEPGKQVVSGAFRVRGAMLGLGRAGRRGARHARATSGASFTPSRITGRWALRARRSGHDRRRYTAARGPRRAKRARREVGRRAGPHLAFDHTSPVGADLEFGPWRTRSIATRSAAMPANMVVATEASCPRPQGTHADISLASIDAAGRASPTPVTTAVSVAALDDDLILSRFFEAASGARADGRAPGRSTDRDARSEGTSPIYFTGWLPGYADPEYFLRLLFHSQSRTNEGGFDHPPFDELIERARQERSDRGRLALFHDADRMAVVDRVAVIPLVYGRSLAVLKPYVHGWWEFGKTSANFADPRSIPDP